MGVNDHDPHTNKTYTTMLMALIISFIIVVVAVLAQFLYVRWWETKPYCPRSEQTKKLGKIFNVFKAFTYLSVIVFFALLVIYCFQFVDYVVLVI